MCDIIYTDKASGKPLGEKGERNMEEMTIAEVNRLIEWLRSKGHTEEEILDCIKQLG